LKYIYSYSQKICDVIIIAKSEVEGVEGVAVSRESKFWHLKEPEYNKNQVQESRVKWILLQSASLLKTEGY